MGTVGEGATSLALSPQQWMHKDEAFCNEDRRVVTGLTLPMNSEGPRAEF